MLKTNQKLKKLIINSLSSELTVQI